MLDLGIDVDNAFQFACYLAGGGLMFFVMLWIVFGCFQACFDVVGSMSKG